MKHLFYLLTSCLLITLSCKRQSPQLPANKVVAVDTVKQTMLAINENLAAREDSLLEKFVATQNKAFRKSSLGFWYRVESYGKGTRIKDKSICLFSVEMLPIKGTVVSVKAKRQKIIIGKKEVIAGLEEGLKLLNKGDSATFIIPWYLAYGMKGDKQHIPSYTSVICRVKLME